MQSFTILALVVAAVLPALSAGGASPIRAPAWDTFSDTWVATDALGRSLPTQPQVGPPRPGKWVGIFYFLWLGRHGEQGPFDISKILAQDPAAIHNPESPRWGPLHAPHHWGESIFGYYLSDDEGVLRKHAQMLADAGVDVVIFDVTNQLTYRQSWQALARAFDRVRRENGHAPQIAFLTPFWSPRKVLLELWDQLYRQNLFPDLWFRWQGKPLILADPAVLTDSEQDRQVRDFFTFRKPQPDYFVGPTGPNQWGWLEVFPQHLFTNAAGEPEQMTVGVAQNAVDGRLSVLSHPRSHGRSFHDGHEPLPAQRDFSGRNFAEQWRRALAVDPAFLFITGWNEWIAGRFDRKAPFYEPGEVTFVDQFSQEFSRDIEPMKGGHGDNFYYQMIANIRRFKGARPLPAVEPRPIRIDGRFDDWAEVTPEFRDTIGDPVHRDFRGWGQAMHYADQTGRNDIIAAKLSYDTRTLFFYVRTRDPLTPPTEPNWMLLFLDTDADPTNGWLGYDFVVKRLAPTHNRAVLERNEGGYHWGEPRRITMAFDRNELELAIPLSALHLPRRLSRLDFKWADNLQQTGEASDFTLNGDAGPNDRYNYRATLWSGP